MAVQTLKNLNKKKSKAKYISRIVLRSTMIAAVVFFALTFLFTIVVSSSSKRKDSSNNSLFGAYVIVSESMIPTIDVNDAIVVKKISNSDLKIGDIITFNSKDYAYNGMTVTHRIVGIQKTASGEKIYRTKGDNNIFIDTALVDLNSIYGKVILIIPKIGYIKSFLTSIPGFLTIIVLPIIIVIVYEIYRIRKLLKRQKKEINSI